MTEYEKTLRLPYLYFFSMFTGASVLIAVGAPFTLFLTELGFGSDRIGILGGLMPFCQILGIAFLPLVMKFGCKAVAIIAFTTRYVFLGLFLSVPILIPDLNAVFYVLFLAMVLFSLSRTIAEVAFVPWSQEIIPQSIRGSISGKISIFYMATGLIVSYLTKIWLDSSDELQRFYPLFIIAIFLGILGAIALKGLGGGNVTQPAVRGFTAIKGVYEPIKDRNFQLFLVSSGTQYTVFLIINLFLMLYFKERFGTPAGQLVLMASVLLIGSAIGSYMSGWLVDRNGSRGVRLSLQLFQILLLVAVAMIPADFTATPLFIGTIFLVFGVLFGGSITAGNVYLLNYVPTESKESYMALSYSIDGLIGGSAIFSAGFLLNVLKGSSVITSVIGAYEVLFIICAGVILISTLTYYFLLEEEATGVRDFLKQFYVGNPLGVLWGIHRYGHQTSEERRLDLTHKFGGAGSVLAREELLNALHDPSFDVRYEAIVALGHLPNSKSVVLALEKMLAYDGLVELQYAALTSLGRIKAIQSGAKIANFLTVDNPLLRARSIRTIGEIRDLNYVQTIRSILANDTVVDCRLAAISALGKFKDHGSFAIMLTNYCEFFSSRYSGSDEPRSKVILLALSKILNQEGAFSKAWRREEKNSGSSLPKLIYAMSDASKQIKNYSTLTLPAVIQTSYPASRDDIINTFAFIQSLKPLLCQSNHVNSKLIVLMLDSTKDIINPHPALLILLAVTILPILKEKSLTALPSDRS